jgi:hypothetical protein
MATRRPGPAYRKIYGFGIGYFCKIPERPAETGNRKDSFESTSIFLIVKPKFIDEHRQYRRGNGYQLGFENPPYFSRLFGSRSYTR